MERSGIADFIGCLTLILRLWMRSSDEGIETARLAHFFRSCVVGCCLRGILGRLSA